MFELKNKEKFKQVCQRYGLELVVLHGSYAKGMVTPKSDIDIGILGRREVIRERYLEIMRDFMEFFGDKFDPVFLNNAEPMITYHVALSGTPFYEKSKGLFNNFKVQALARYMDSKKFRELEKQYIKAAIRRETE